MRKLIRGYMLPGWRRAQTAPCPDDTSPLCGVKRGDVGDTIQVDVDLVFLHEALGRAIKALDELSELGGNIKDPDKVVVLFDHWVPAPKEEAARNQKRIREYVKKVGLKHFFDAGRGGICHQLVAEEGYVLPGTLVLGSDSHTTTLGHWVPLPWGLGRRTLSGYYSKGGPGCRSHHLSALKSRAPSDPLYRRRTYRLRL